MADEKEKAIDVDKLLKNKLKSLSIGDLDKRNCQSCCQLVGEDYKCTINDVKYTLFSGADFHVKIELSYNPDE